MAILILIPSVVFGSFIFLGALDKMVPAFNIIIVFVLLAASIAAAYTFFWPLLDIHNEMIHSRDRYFDEAVNNISSVRELLREKFQIGQIQDDKTMELATFYEKTIKLFPLDINYPTWPFSTSTRIVFLVGQFITILTITSTVLDLIKLLPNK
jgi:hypothetical protein